jgi:hypothetical protein
LSIAESTAAPSADDVRAWAAACGARDLVPDLVASLATVEGMFVEWRRMERTGLRRAQESVLPLWERTRQFRSYASWLVPGAVQTSNYTRAVLRATAARRELPDDVEDAVRARIERQRLLHEGGRTFALLVEESVLRTVIGDADVMAGQLGHLLTLGGVPSVSLGVLPMGVVRDEMRPVESFWIFDNKQVNIELISGYLTITQPSEVAMYADAFGRLRKLAIFGAEARSRITAAIDAL